MGRALQMGFFDHTTAELHKHSTFHVIPWNVSVRINFAFS
jgi:hypothetical protein